MKVFMNARFGFLITMLLAWEATVETAEARFIPGDSGVVSWSVANNQTPTPGFDSGGIVYSAFKARTIIIWSDADSTSGGFHETDSKADADGVLRFDTAMRSTMYSWTYEVEKNKGKVVIDGQPFDLSGGSFFLVSGQGKTVVVQQLKREPKELVEALSPKLDRIKALNFGKMDKEISGFFTRHSKNQNF